MGRRRTGEGAEVPAHHASLVGIRQDEKLVSESLVRAKRLWEDCGYVMQEDRGILPILFIRRFPSGFTIAPVT